MALQFINDQTIYLPEDFPSREDLLNMTEDIKIIYYLQYIKKNMLISIINNQKQYTLNLIELNSEPWILNKVIKILKSKGYWITETNESITILW